MSVTGFTDALGSDALPRADRNTGAIIQLCQALFPRPQRSGQISVHEAHDPSPGVAHTGEYSRGFPPVVLGKEANVWTTLDEATGNLNGSIGASVVHNDDLRTVAGTIEVTPYLLER